MAVDNFNDWGVDCDGIVDFSTEGSTHLVDDLDHENEGYDSEGAIIDAGVDLSDFESLKLWLVSIGEELNPRVLIDGDTDAGPVSSELLLEPQDRISKSDFEKILSNLIAVLPCVEPFLLRAKTLDAKADLVDFYSNSFPLDLIAQLDEELKQMVFGVNGFGWSLRMNFKAGEDRIRQLMEILLSDQARGCELFDAICENNQNKIAVRVDAILKQSRGNVDLFYALMNLHYTMALSWHQLQLLSPYMLRIVQLPDLQLFIEVVLKNSDLDLHGLLSLLYFFENHAEKVRALGGDWLQLLCEQEPLQMNRYAAKLLADQHKVSLDRVVPSAWLRMNDRLNALYDEAETSDYDPSLHPLRVVSQVSTDNWSVALVPPGTPGLASDGTVAESGSGFHDYWNSLGHSGEGLLSEHEMEIISEMGFVSQSDIDLIARLHAAYPKVDISYVAYDMEQYDVQPSIESFEAFFLVLARYNRAEYNEHLFQALEDFFVCSKHLGEEGILEEFNRAKETIQSASMELWEVVQAAAVFVATVKETIEA